MKKVVFYAVLKRRMLFFWCALAFIGTSCSFNTGIDEERIILLLPEIPQQICDALHITRWNIVLPDLDGSRRVYSQTIDTKTFTLTVQKNALTPVLCYPLLDSEVNGKIDIPILKPAGAIYPANTSGIREKTLSLTWQAGFSALFLRTLLERSKQSYHETARAYSYFNWNRFQEETGKHKNPWALDTDKLFAAILNERVAVYSFTSLPCTEIPIQLETETDFLHSTYLPEGYIAVKTDTDHPASAQKTYFCPLIASANSFISPQHVYHVSTENSRGRLAITAIRRYTGFNAE